MDNRFSIEITRHHPREGEHTCVIYDNYNKKTVRVIRKPYYESESKFYNIIDRVIEDLQEEYNLK